MPVTHVYYVAKGTALDLSYLVLWQLYDDYPSSCVEKYKLCAMEKSSNGGAAMSDGQTTCNAFRNTLGCNAIYLSYAQEHSPILMLC